MTDAPRDPNDLTEEELAEYFYAHRDELAGEEVTSVEPKRLDVMFSARFSRDEAEAVRGAADRAGMPLSAYLRYAVLAVEDKHVDLDRVRRDLARVRALSNDA